MSAHSTIRISRRKALQAYLEKVLSNPSNEELEEFMDKILDDRLYNCIIVSDDEDNDDYLV